MYRRKTIRLLLVSTVLAVFAGACSVGVNPVTGKRKMYAYSWQDEIRIGQQVDIEIRREYGEYPDEELREYVVRVGEDVLQHSHLRREGARQEFIDTEFTFRVLDSPVVNAFAVPGGFIYVTRGLMAHMENEAQFAVVLGHEISHVAARHSSQRALKSTLGQIGLIGGAILGEAVFDIPAQDLMNIGGTAMNFLMLSYSRDDEREADRLGVEYAAFAGYDAKHGSDFFGVLKRMQVSAGGGLPTWQSTHPDPGDREKTIIQLAMQWEEKGYDLSRVERETYLNQLHGSVVGDNPRHGFVSGGFFYHPDMAFFFPAPVGWHVVNQPTQVQFIEPSSRNAALMLQIAHGVRSPQEAAREFAGGDGVTVRSEQQVRIDGNPAYTVIADISQKDGEIRVRRTFIEFDGTVFDFIGVAPVQAFSRHDGLFGESQFGFQRLSDERILNTQPVRINVVRAQQTAQFGTLVPRELPDGFTPEDLAIMNQVELDEIIPEGRLLKLLSW